MACFPSWWMIVPPECVMKGVSIFYIEIYSYQLKHQVPWAWSVMEEMFKRQKYTFDRLDNIMPATLEKSTITIFKGLLTLGGPLLWGFFFFGPDQMAKLSKTFYEKNLQPREECYITFCVWIDLTTQTGTWNNIT